MNDVARSHLLINMESVTVPLFLQSCFAFHKYFDKYINVLMLTGEIEAIIVVTLPCR